jgi:hypothetical protein
MFFSRGPLTSTLLLILLVAGLGCSAALLPAAKPANTPIPTTPPARFQVNPQTAESGLAGLGSYRADYQLVFNGIRGDQQVSGEILQTEYVNGDDHTVAQVITSTSLGFQTVGYTQLADRVYVERDGEFFWLEREAAPAVTPADAGLFNLRSFIRIPPYVGTAPLAILSQGVPVHQYHFSGDDITNPAFTITRAEGQLEVPPEETYLMGYTLTATINSVTAAANEPHLMDTGEIILWYTLRPQVAVTITSPENKTPPVIHW